LRVSGPQNEGCQRFPLCNHTQAYRNPVSNAGQPANFAADSPHLAMKITLTRWFRPHAVVMVLFAGWALARTAHAADAPATGDFKLIDRTNFTLKYPVAWKEATDDPDYKAESHLTINGPDKKNSYVSFDIVDKTQDTIKLLASTIESLDGYAINALTKTKIEEWGQFKGTGMHLKGKILDAYPGGIKVFIFNSDHHNIMVIEYYWAEELKDLQADIDYIQNNFVMKN